MSQGNDFQDNSNVSQDGGSPFSADLKGDFTSNFGTNTNAVSQIFKEGGFVGENKSKLIGVVALVVAVLLGGYVFLGSDEDYGDDDFVVAEDDEDIDDIEDIEDLDDADEDIIDSDPLDEDIDDSSLSDNEIESDPEPILEEALPDPTDEVEYVESESTEYLPEATVAPSIVSPADGFARVYDETMVPPEFIWEGSPGGWLVVSQNSSMNPVSIRRRVSENSYRLRKLLPGTWFWQVRNGAGKSGVRSVVITDAPTRVLSLSEPTEGGSLTGSGGVVTWTGDNKVAFYRVEISSNGWASPMYRFATSGTQLRVQDVAPGQYQLRVGGFSEVSGRWEYSEPVNISVQ
ncbi:MAG: hypothetical protein AB8G05_14845 [Oligoflexales bacterium]